MCKYQSDVVDKKLKVDETLTLIIARWQEKLCQKNITLSCMKKKTSDEPWIKREKH